MSELAAPATPATTVRPEIERDTWGRPLVVPPTGGKKVGYTRCTTFVGSIDDTYKLGLWQQRHVLRGTSLHEDIIAAVRDTDPDDKKSLDVLAEEAKERSGAGDAARMGTYLHAVTEAADRGEDPAAVARPWLSTGDLDPDAYRADLDAYLEATTELAAVQIEQFTVNDPLKVGGTPDRVVKYRGKRYIADLKTGSIEWGGLKIAAQLALYARSRPYDPATHERLEAHGAETDRGIVVHLPVGTGTCRLYWVDLAKGWEAVQVCRRVREQRTVRFRHLFRELEQVPDAATLPPVMGLEEQIGLCTTRAAVEALWRANAAGWNDALTDLAKAHIASLAGTTTTTTTTTEGARA